MPRNASHRSRPAIAVPTKIRTYNFLQARVTDHRINFTAHRLPAVLEGDLDERAEALGAADAAERLAAVGAGSENGAESGAS